MANNIFRSLGLKVTKCIVGDVLRRRDWAAKVYFAKFAPVLKKFVWAEARDRKFGGDQPAPTMYTLEISVFVFPDIILLTSHPTHTLGILVFVFHFGDICFSSLISYFGDICICFHFGFLAFSHLYFGDIDICFSF